MTAVDRSKLPLVGPNPTFSFPEICKSSLTNGLRILTVQHQSVPVIIFRLLIPVGSAADPSGRFGLSALTGDLLDEGSGDRSGPEIQDALSRIGATLDIHVSSDSTILTLMTLSKFSSYALSLLADITLYPHFDVDEFTRARDLRLNRLAQLRNFSAAISDRVFIENLYRGHPYGHLPIGNDDSLQEISVEEVRTFYESVYLPQNMTLVAVGDVGHEDLSRFIASAFCSPLDTLNESRITSSLELHPQSSLYPEPFRDRLLFVNRPNAVQSELRIGQVSVSRCTPDYHSLLVLNMVLGGQFVSRINLNLREDKGYTYGAKTAFDFRRGCGPFLLQSSVQTEATSDAIREVLSELHAIRGDRPAGISEIDVACASLTRGYPRNFETALQTAYAVSQLALFELPDNTFSEFVSHVEAVDSETVTQVAKSHIDPDRLLVVVVGDREKVLLSLEGVGLGSPTEVSLLHR